MWAWWEIVVLLWLCSEIVPLKVAGLQLFNLSLVLLVLVGDASSDVALVEDSFSTVGIVAGSSFSVPLLKVC